MGKFCAHITGPEGHHVCAIVANVPASHFKAEEVNARMIAAAPDLLAALESILFQARGATCDENKFRICELAQEAIAKASS